MQTNPTQANSMMLNWIWNHPQQNWQHP